jgi:hypothetical protein
MMNRSKTPRLAPGVRLSLGVTLALFTGLARPSSAQATEAEQVSLEEDSSAAAAKKEEPEDDKPKKRVVAPYSLPWQLRPAVPQNLARADNSFAFYGVDGATIVSELSVSYKVLPRLALIVKLGVAEASPPTGPGGFGLFNPMVGGQVGFWPAKSVRIGGFLGLTVPVGMGGGTTPTPGSQNVNGAAMLARSGMDNPLFMPDYFTAWPGFDLAYVTKGFTAQGEVSMAFLTKVRGPQTQKTSNVDLSMGLHLGYFFFPFASFGVDLRHQRWLTNVSYVANDPSREIRDTTTIGFGPRAHINLSDTLRFRPGLSLSFGLDRPVASSKYKIVQIDLPFNF